MKASQHEPKRVARFARGLLVGAGLGTVLIGGGGRLVMRLLTLFDGRTPGFSLGGTLEILAYGAAVGAVVGLLYAWLPVRWRARWTRAGLGVGLAAYVGTIATLPAHIAETAAPFAARIEVVLALFGACFLAFGLGLARLSLPRRNGP